MAMDPTLMPDNQEGLEETGVPETLQYPNTPVELVEESQPEDVRVPQTSDGRVVASPAASAAPAEALGVESCTWDELRKLRSQLEYCSKCKMPVTATPVGRVTGKTSGTKLTCRQCHNTVTMLYKRWDMTKISFRDLSDKEQTDFFLKAKQLTASGDKLTVGKIQALLIRKMTEIERQTQETAVKGKYLPLSVWEKKGFDIVAIEQRAERQPSDLFGFVYRVPILELNFSHVEESVRESIMSAQRKVAPKKRTCDDLVFVRSFLHVFVLLRQRS